jgi:hypothetical protein
MTTQTLRPLSAIGAEMVPLLRALPESHMARWAGLAQAVPLCSLDTIHDSYGDDSAEYVVACLLGNISGWRGDDAKRIRAELKAHLAQVQRRRR